MWHTYAAGPKAPVVSKASPPVQNRSGYLADLRGGLPGGALGAGEALHVLVPALEIRRGRELTRALELVEELRVALRGREAPDVRVVLQPGLEVVVHGDVSEEL